MRIDGSLSGSSALKGGWSGIVMHAWTTSPIRHSESGLAGGAHGTGSICVHLYIVRNARRSGSNFSIVVMMAPP